MTAPVVDDAAIRFGREIGLEIGVRGGGHSVAGKALADGGLVVDLRRMNAVAVDPDARTATVGGGATSFTFRLHRLPSVTAALLVWSRDRGPEVVRAYRDFIEAAPDEIGGGAMYLTGPAEDFVPARLVGELTLLVLVTYAGAEAGARTAMAPMLAMAPEGRMIAEMPYAELQCMLDDPPGYRNYWSAEYLDAVPDEARRSTPSRGGGRPGASTPSACGRTRRTTNAPGGGRTTSAPTCDPGRPVTCTSTSSATRAATGWWRASAARTTTGSPR